MSPTSGRGSEWLTANPRIHVHFPDLGIVAEPSRVWFGIIERQATKRPPIAADALWDSNQLDPFAAEVVSAGASRSVVGTEGGGQSLALCITHDAARRGDRWRKPDVGPT